MATFVIVHGGWGGGWEWTAVARRLRAHGHDAFTPTLTGMGERAHLGGPHVGLATHVADVVAVLESEDLGGVVLCGHSYGGMPVTGAADRVPERVAAVVYLDALVPADGQRAFDLLPGPFEAMAVAAAGSPGGDGWRVPMPPAVAPPEGLLPPAERDRYLARLRDQPLGSFAEPIRLTGAVESLPRAFVHCVGHGLGGDLGDPIAPVAARARAAGWPYRELATPHDPQLFDPATTAAVLDELVQAMEVG